MAKRIRKIPALALPKRRKERNPAEAALYKRRRLKYIAVLPTAVTLMNALCGFLAIIYASRESGMYREIFLFDIKGLSFLAMSGYLILIAMVADMLDGQVARWSGVASGFGGQLDSLSDVLSFGAAPAFLMFIVMEKYNWVVTFKNWIFFAAIFFVLCTIIRLARFNVENDTDLSRHQSFAGLPSPAAAGVVVSIVIFIEDFLPGIAGQYPELNTALLKTSIWILPIITIFSGFLMVSRIRYPHLVNRLFGKKRSFASVLLVLFSLLLIMWNIQLTILFGFCCFAILGFTRGIIVEIVKLISKGKKQSPPAEPGRI